MQNKNFATAWKLFTYFVHIVLGILYTQFLHVFVKVLTVGRNRLPIVCLHSLQPFNTHCELCLQWTEKNTHNKTVLEYCTAEQCSIYKHTWIARSFSHLTASPLSRTLLCLWNTPSRHVDKMADQHLKVKCWTKKGGRASHNLTSNPDAVSWPERVLISGIGRAKHT